MRWSTAGLFAVMSLTGSLSLPVSRPGLHVDRTAFVLTDGTSRLMSADLVGSEIRISDGVVFRIDDVRRHPQDPEIWLHSFSVRLGPGDWQNPCLTDANGKAEGFPLPGRWDSGGFHPDDQHFALVCTSGAEAKCVLQGYKPWASSADGSSLLPLYESCVRMLRADYCGDGTPWTRDGTTIVIYDDRAVNPSDSELDPIYRFEAGWSPRGAVCVSHTRIRENISLERLIEWCPRLVQSVGAACTESFARKNGAVLFNKSRVDL